MMNTSKTHISPYFALPPAGYSRRFDAQLDYLGDGLMRVQGVISDHRVSIEYTWQVQVPDYTVVAADCRHLAGEADVLAPALQARAQHIAGQRTSHGFSRAVRAAVGDLPGHREHLALAIDMARISLQGFPVPRGDHERFAARAAGIPPGPSRIARMAWERDRADWAGICNSCYAYSDAAAALFAQRTVTCFDVDLVSPEPGQQRFFWRAKRLTIAPAEQDQGFVCRNEMNDTFHDLDITLGLGRDGVVETASNTHRRLAFAGICEDAQRGPPTLAGTRLDSDFARVIAEHVGGRTGCSHLFDLSVDCLRCFEWSV